MYKTSMALKVNTITKIVHMTLPPPPEFPPPSSPFFLERVRLGLDRLLPPPSSKLEWEPLDFGDASIFVVAEGPLLLVVLLVDLNMLFPFAFTSAIH